MTDLERRLMLVLEDILQCRIVDPDDEPDDEGSWYHVPPDLDNRMTKAYVEATELEARTR